MANAVPRWRNTMSTACSSYQSPLFLRSRSQIQCNKKLSHPLFLTDAMPLPDTQNHPDTGCSWDAFLKNRPDTGCSWGAFLKNRPDTGCNWGAFLKNHPDTGCSWGVFLKNRPDTGCNWGAFLKNHPDTGCSWGVFLKNMPLCYQKREGAILCAPSLFLHPIVRCLHGCACNRHGAFNRQTADSSSLWRSPSREPELSRGRLQDD